MTTFSLEIMAEKSGVSMLQNSSKIDIEYLLTDSRTLTFAPTTCFFAIISARNNGHKYLAYLYAKGVRNFVVSDSIELSQFPEASFLKVENTIEALQLFASEKRKLFKGEVIAITGSNGKTIIKEWLYQVLRKHLFVSRSPKSYNSQIGVALSLWNIDPHADVVLVEAGISESGEMEKLQRMIAPDVVLMTNLGPAHQQNFSTLQHKANEKMKLAKEAKQVFYCRDYPELSPALQKSNFQGKSFTWSGKDDGLCNATIDKFNDYSAICLLEEADSLLFTIPFTDDASIENAIHTCCVARWLELPIESIMKSLANLEPVEMRLQLKNGINGCKIINDTYNSDILSLSIALDFLVQQSCSQKLKRTLILSDIQQSGKSKEELYAEVEKLIVSKSIHTLVGIGEDVSENLQNIPVESYFYSTTKKFIQDQKKFNFSNEVILLKGAREFQFEELSKLFEVRINKTRLEINLNALLHNFHYYKGLLKSTTKIMGMVKAFAYGSGSLEVARLLQYHGCNYLAVAMADEGVELRNGGIDLPILVLGTEREAFQKIIEHRLEPEIYSFSILNDLIIELSKQKIEQYLIHLKFDTGMHRFGFMDTDVEVLIQLLKQTKEVKVQSVFTHLAASDDKSMDEFTENQLLNFQKITNKLKSGIQNPFLTHALNSAGIDRFPKFEMDMVRLGIGLYGVSDTHFNSLRHVVMFKTNIAQIKKVGANQSVGYGRKGWTKKESLIATIPVGYADGFNRKLSNGLGEVLLNGKKVPVIGNVCMDLTMLDITGVDAAEGDEVILMGNEINVEEWARKLETIPYEVLTNISQRVKRVYLTE